MSRAIVGACPGCGAQITLRAADSMLAVCEYCSTMCVRQGDRLSKAGVMGALFDDHSPLTLGAIGRFDGKSFQLVGRLQYRYPDGVWNEWRALFDDGEAAWLSEDNGSYSFSMSRGTVAAPSFDAIEPGQQQRFEGTDYRVTYKERATVIAGAGELPFVVGSGYLAPVCDLRGPNGEIATLDYSDLTGTEAFPDADSMSAKPLLYLGRAVMLAELELQGLSENRDREVALQAFSCPRCGATVAPRFDDTKSLTCASCSSLLDVSEGLGEKIQLREQSVPPDIDLPLGSVGTIGGARWTVVGYLQRRGDDGEDVFGWEEYLLHNEQAGFRFLNLDSGHWSLGRILQKSFRITVDKFGRGYVEHEARRYDQYARYEASVTYVMGEFFWRVSVNDKVQLVDFICPPRVLSREQEANEIVWTEAQYLSPEEIRQAFDLPETALPKPQGPGLLAELPQTLRPYYLMMGAIALCCLVVLQGLFMWMGTDAELVQKTGVRFNGKPSTHQIVLSGERPVNLEVAISSDVTNSAFGLSAELTSATLGVQRQLATEIGYYEGYESGESWSEGDRDGRLVFTALKPGPYTLTLTADDLEKEPQFPWAGYSVSQQGRPLWLPFFIGLALVIGLTLYGWFKEPDPLTKRWRESQYGSKPGSHRLYYSRPDDGGNSETSED